MTLILLHSSLIDCPYCGERIELLIDTSEPQQEIIEDCSVCCRPITLRLSCIPGELLELSAQREDEV
ncbi:MAG: CPXCG motif-containing cysteine-rich protein [Candidatus Thiodiazotropha sp.]